MQGARVTDSPKTIHLNQNLLRMQKEGNGFLRHTNDQGTLSCLFFLLLCPRVNQTFMLKRKIEGRGEIGQSFLIHPGSINFSSSLACSAYGYHRQKDRLRKREHHRYGGQGTNNIGCISQAIKDVIQTSETHRDIKPR